MVAKSKVPKNSLQKSPPGNPVPPRTEKEREEENGVIGNEISPPDFRVRKLYNYRVSEKVS